MGKTVKRLTELDVLRGIAIFLVVFGHVTHISELRNYIWGSHTHILFYFWIPVPTRKIRRVFYFS